MANHDQRQEDAFLEKIAGKLGRPTPAKIALRETAGPPDFWLKIKPGKDELLTSFVANAEHLTAKVYVSVSKEQMRRQLKQWLGEIAAQSVICWNSPELKYAGIAEVCREAGARVTTWNAESDRQEMIEHCASADAGITWADYGIANSGSLALMSGPAQGRSVSLLPPVHIALIKRDSIVAHVGDILNAVDPQKIPSAISMITGPSRTSDIEMDLALGVHGPGQVYIMIVDYETF